MLNVHIVLTSAIGAVFLCQKRPLQRPLFLFLSAYDRQQLAPLTSKLRGQEPFLVCTDYGAYLDCQDTVEARYRDTEQWTRMSILNVARIGRFSSDRAIREYAEGIWRVQPVPVKG
jgi:starch phosphorylase